MDREVFETLLFASWHDWKDLRHSNYVTDLNMFIMFLSTLVICVNVKKTQDLKWNLLISFEIVLDISTSPKFVTWGKCLLLLPGVRQMEGARSLSDSKRVKIWIKMIQSFEKSQIIRLKNLNLSIFVPIITYNYSYRKL